MFRLFFVTFFGAYRGDAHAHGSHAPAWLMAAPVAILGVFAVVAGYIMIGPASPWGRFFATSFPKESLPQPAVSELVTTLLAVLMFALGCGLAYRRYMSKAFLENAPAQLERETRTLPAVLVNLYYFNELIGVLFVRPAYAIGAFLGQWFDPHAIDGAVRETVLASRFIGNAMRALQSGLLRSYALVLVFGATAFVVYYALEGAGR